MQNTATLFVLALCSAAASVVNSFFGVFSVGARKETELSHWRVLVPQPSVEAGKAVLKWVRQGIHGPRSFDRRLHLHAGRCRLPGATRRPSHCLRTHPACSSPEIPDHTRPPHAQCASAISQELCVFPRRWISLLNSGCHCWLVQQCLSSWSCLAASSRVTFTAEEILGKARSSEEHCWASQQWHPRTIAILSRP